MEDGMRNIQEPIGNEQQNKEMPVEEEMKLTGKRQFGVNKGVVSRAVVKFSGPPKPHPFTACFHFPSTFLTHKYVLEMIKNVLSDRVDNYRIAALQFVDRNTIHGAQGMDNRWLITFNDVAPKNLLVTQGLTLFNRKVVVHSYDDILKEEYQEFLAYKELKEKLFIKSDQSKEKQGDLETSEN